MPVPRYDTPECKPSEAEVKSDYIVRMLLNAGYDIEDERDAVHVIEEHGIDKFTFDYPYGSFEEYKKHVLAGEFDVDMEDVMTTDEERAELIRSVKAGESYIIYENLMECKAMVIRYPKNTVTKTPASDIHNIQELIDDYLSYEADEKKHSRRLGKAELLLVGIDLSDKKRDIFADMQRTKRRI